MKKKNDYQFDFSLFINDKIICQRFFDDHKFKNNEIDFHQVIQIIMEPTNLIKDLLKSQSIELLWKNYDTCNHKTLFHKESKSDLFKVTISYNSKILVSSCIDGNIYQPKIKYGVDIRPIIPSIISSIRLNLIK